MPRMPPSSGSIPLQPTPDASTASAPAEPPQIVTVSVPDYALVGQMGAELSLPINTLQGLLNGLQPGMAVSAQQLQQLQAAVASASHIARQSQQIARLAEGHLRQSHERLHLDQLLHQAVQEHMPALKARGVELHCNIKPVEIIVDPGLLFSLVDSALEWACAGGQRLVISLGIKNWPEHGLLALRVTGQTGVAQPDTESLQWHLMSHIARAMEVTVEQEIRDNGDAILLMEFSRTVRHLEGLTHQEMDDATGDSSFYTSTKPLVGSRILLVSNDPLVRGEVDEACRMLSLKVDTVPGVPQATQYVKLGLPQLIIIDERRRDDAFDHLLQEIKQLEPDFGVLEITDDANTFEISSWMSESMTRVSRELLRTQLPSVLTRELARAL